MKSLLRVLSYLKPYRKKVALTLFLAISTTLLDLVPPWLIKVIIDNLVETTEMPGAYWPVIGLAVVYLARNFTNHKRIIINNKVEQDVVFDLRSEVYRSLQKLSLSYFESRSTGELMSRANDDVNYVERIFIDGVEQVVRHGLGTCSSTAGAVMVLLTEPGEGGGVRKTRSRDAVVVPGDPEASDRSGNLRDLVDGFLVDFLLGAGHACSPSGVVGVICPLSRRTLLHASHQWLKSGGISASGGMVVRLISEEMEKRRQSGVPHVDLVQVFAESRVPRMRAALTG
mgnify:CR=1 FL=1